MESSTAPARPAVAGAGRGDAGVSVRVLFEPRDLWLGVYWDRRPGALVVYVCVLPMLPIRIEVRR